MVVELKGQSLGGVLALAENQGAERIGKVRCLGGVWHLLALLPVR